MKATKKLETGTSLIVKVEDSIGDFLMEFPNGLGGEYNTPSITVEQFDSLSPSDVAENDSQLMDLFAKNRDKFDSLTINL